MGLFAARGDQVEALAARSFGDVHTEARIQAWADTCPALINDGVPMLSLGQEIVTRHNHSIDNLYIDGNGVLVAAEMKRGRSPRDVVAQVLDYAAFVSSLDWPAVKVYCRKRQGKDLDLAFVETFGRPLVRTDKPEHRLLIVAESFDPRVTDAALYLINGGLPLSLMQFTYFESGDRAILDVRCVLGEIPDQRQAQAAMDSSSPPDGYAEWLLGSLAKDLEAFAQGRSLDLRIRLNKLTLPFGLMSWPLPLGELQLRADVYKADAVTLRLSFRKELAPGLQEFLEAKWAEWVRQFPAQFENPPYPTVFASLSRDLLRPKIGDQVALDAVARAQQDMAEALIPLINAYFASQGA
ncbi:MAG: hypothetical protein SFV19_01640 [Rhodospirillaceae bacterium]|nr:hypothetical protein [Rhodospirillaceae bacterium]